MVALSILHLVELLICAQVNYWSYSKRVSNLIKLVFLNKKHFPPGKWKNEPDICSWTKYDLSCLAIRDMSLGTWKGFVGIGIAHPLYFMDLESILKEPQMIDAFLAIYGGISSAGKLPSKYKDYADNLWWIGCETSHGGDYMPLLKIDTSDLDMAKMLSGQTYKDLVFIRNETNKLAKYVSRFK